MSTEILNKMFYMIENSNYRLKTPSADAIIKESMRLGINSNFSNYIELTVLDDERLDTNNEHVIVLKNLSLDVINKIINLNDMANLYGSPNCNNVNVNRICFTGDCYSNMNEAYNDFKQLKNSSVIISFPKYFSRSFENNPAEILSNFKSFVREICLIKSLYTRVYFIFNFKNCNDMEKLLLEIMYEYYRVNVFTKN